jgi:hypothetical protein
VTIDAYLLPGVAPATSGWVCPDGTLGHSRRPR